VSYESELERARKALPPLPDVSEWWPGTPKNSETLQQAFYNRCGFAELEIIQRALNERKMNIQNFDSGSGTEDIVRENLRSLLPLRYGVHAATLDDRNGQTAGDFDVVVTNDHWFPAIKPGATQTSRRVHRPIEALYAVVEVKETLNASTLDQAMKKLVTANRLRRPYTGYSRITENRREASHSQGPSNLLYSAIIATQIGKVPFEVLIERFFDISKCLRRHELVRALVVLGVGSVTWGTRGAPGTIEIARDFLHEDLVPGWHKATGGIGALYPFVADMLANLYHAVLPAEDIAAMYAPSLQVAAPRDSGIVLRGSEQWWHLGHESEAQSGIVWPDTAT
jgi:hypothetical protein